MSGSRVDLNRLDAEIQELLESLNEIDFPLHYPSPGIINSEEEKNRSLVFSIFHYQCVVMHKHIDDIRQFSPLIILYLTPQQMSELRRTLEMCVSHLTGWREIGVTNFEVSFDGIFRSRVYQEREQLINSLAHNSSFAKTHYLQGYVPFDRNEAAKSIGSLVVEHFRSDDPSVELEEKIVESRRLVEQLDLRINNVRVLEQTKEMLSIAKRYKDLADAKSKQSAWLFLGATLALICIPVIIHFIALGSGVEKGVFNTNPGPAIAILATLTLAISGMLFKLAWTIFQQKLVAESRSKLCEHLTDFLKNFEGTINAEEVVRMIAYALFIDGSPASTTMTEMSAMTSTKNALASSLKSDGKP